MFHKVLEEDDEPRQAEFKVEVGHYVNGRFWRSFTDPLWCNKAVGEALKELQVDAGPVRRETPPGPVAVPWLGDITPAVPVLVLAADSATAAVAPVSFRARCTRRCLSCTWCRSACRRS